MRKSRLKRVIFQIHLWGGLILGLYALLIGITGSVLVFREEIVGQIAPHPRVPDPAQDPSIEAIRNGIQARYPDWHVWALSAPSEPGAPWSSFLLRPGNGLTVFADHEGRVIGEHNIKGTWLELFQRFHSNLLIPRGRLYNGIAGLLLVVIAISGIVLWWPARNAWNTAFRIVRRSNWKGVVYDLHRVGGAVTAAFFVMLCLTGAYYTWPAVYRDIAARLLPTKPNPRPALVLTKGTRQPLDALAAAANRAVPEARLLRVLVPRGQNEAVRVVFAHGEKPDNRKISQVTVNPHTGEVLGMDDYRERRAGDHLVSWMGPLHTGHFGGLGIKVVWALAGLAFPALLVTGFIMWCNRVLAPRLQERKPARETIASP